MRNRFREPRKKMFIVHESSQNPDSKAVGPVSIFSRGWPCPLEKRGRCTIVSGVLLKHLPSLVTESGNSLHRLQALGQRRIMTCKCFERGNTLSLVHAEMEMMEGRNFLGSNTARKEWRWAAWPWLDTRRRQSGDKRHNHMIGTLKDKFIYCGHGKL